MDLRGCPLNLVNPWSVLLLMWSTLNALGHTPMGRDERRVVLDACAIITLVPTGDIVSGHLTFERGFKIKLAAAKKLSKCFTDLCLSACLLEMLSSHSFPNLS